MPFIIDVRVEARGSSTVVTPVWGSLDTEPAIDRPDSFSIRVPAHLVDRYVAAVREGAVFVDPKIETDVNGKTYVSKSSNVMGRYLNADLNRLGF